MDNKKIASVLRAVADKLTDYRMSHGAPDRRSGGAPLHDVEVVMPDYYTHPHYYFSDSDRRHDRNVSQLIYSFKGQPDRWVTIYRAVPGNVTTINPGDWVTISKKYAQDHMAGEQGWHILSKEVPAKELFTAGDSHFEWGWDPTPDSINEDLN